MVLLNIILWLLFILLLLGGWRSIYNLLTVAFVIVFTGSIIFGILFLTIKVFMFIFRLAS